MSRRTAVFTVLAALGLALYLWPALRAPVVLWSDSTIDLEWARSGLGILSPAPPQPETEEPSLHPAKPAYLLFLRLGQALAPDGKETRTIVVLQSLLLWLSIVGTSIFVARRHGGSGVALLAVLLLFLRLRASASTIMPEALSAALLLPVAAILLDPPSNRVRLLLLGIAIALLFWVRPNVGAIALGLALARLGAIRRGSAIALVVSGFLVLFLPVWIATRPHESGERLRGLGHPIYFGSTDYYWAPRTGEIGRPPREIETRELGRAVTNWGTLLRSRGPDARRQLVWRAVHGLLGSEFSSAPFWSRVLAPFLTLAAISVVFAALIGRSHLVAALLGILLVLLLVAQNLLLGSNPRFAVPLLPALYLFGVVGVERRSLPAAGAVLAALLVFAARQPYALDLEWGRIEAAGIRITQRIPRGALPDREPATLHVRIAPPLLPSTAHLEIRAAGEFLYSSAGDRTRERPAISIPLSQSFLDRSSREPIELELRSSGSYGETQYLLFPVIPPPWRRSASRDGSPELSPSTGIRRGALDWWAHPGAP